MLDFRRDKDHTSRADRTIFVTHVDHPSSADHVIHFILGMRLLWVDAARRQMIYTDAQTRYADELMIKFAGVCLLLKQFGKFVSIHTPTTALHTQSATMPSTIVSSRLLVRHATSPAKMPATRKLFCGAM